MLRLIILKEIREIAYSSKFVLTFGAMSVLILLSFYAGALNYGHAREEFDASSAELLEQVEQEATWSSVSVNVYLEPQPLEAVVTGLMNDISRHRTVTIQMAPPGQTSRFNEDPIWAMFRIIDLEFILTVVLSLFAIVFAYDAVSGERERGTLALAMSNAVPRDTLLLGKLIGSFIALFVPLLIPLLVGASLLPILGVPMTGDDTLRLVLVVLAGGLYLGLFLTLSTLVSSLARRSSTSFLVLTVAWLLFVLVLPRFAVFVAGRTVHVPSQASLDYQWQKNGTDLFEADRDKLDGFHRNQDWTGVTREQHDAEFADFFGGLRAEQSRKNTAFTERLRVDATNRKRARDRLAIRLARISPSTSMKMIATSLAGTGVETEYQFEDALSQYHRDYRAFVISQEGTAAFAQIPMAPGPDATSVDFSEMPRFTFVRPGIRQVLAASLWDYASLILFNLLLFGLCIVVFRRSDLRQSPS